MPRKAGPFWTRYVETPAGCWEWTGHRDADGYGRVTVRALSPFSTRAHRIAWMLSNGAIPGGLQVLHHCDNRPCINPEHLFLGTNTDNIADASAKGRLPGRPRLTADQVEVIRARLRAGESQQQLRAEFGVHENTVRRIKNNRAWHRLATTGSDSVGRSRRPTAAAPTSAERRAAGTG